MFEISFGFTPQNMLSSGSTPHNLLGSTPHNLLSSSGATPRGLDQGNSTCNRMAIFNFICSYVKVQNHRFLSDNSIP